MFEDEMDKASPPDLVEQLEEAKRPKVKVTDTQKEYLRRMLKAV